MTLKRRVPYPITAADTAALTVPATRVWRFTGTQITGKHSPHATVTAKVAPSGVVLADAFTVLDAVPVREGYSIPMVSGVHVLVAGDVVYLSANGDDRATFFASYDETLLAAGDLGRVIVAAPAAEAVIATVPAGKRWRIIGFQASGLYAGGSELTVKIGVSGTDYTLADGLFVSDAQVEPLLVGNMVLEAGDTIQASADGANRVNIWMSHAIEDI